jgi:hypothetical protein
MCWSYWFCGAIHYSLRENLYRLAMSHAAASGSQQVRAVLKYIIASTVTLLTTRVMQ